MGVITVTLFLTLLIAKTISAEHRFFPVSCDNKTFSIKPEDLNCYSYPNRNIATQDRIITMNVPQVWNRGRSVEVEGHICRQYSISTVCQTNVFGMTELSHRSILLSAEVSGCQLAILKFKQGYDIPLSNPEPDCSWMKTRIATSSFYKVTPNSVQYDLITKQYKNDIFGSRTCSTDICILSDGGSLWVKEAAVIDKCQDLPRSVVTFSQSMTHHPVTEGAVAISSLMLHATNTTNSCLLKICNIDGLVLSTGEWISMEPGMSNILSKQDQTPCTDRVGMLKSVISSDESLVKLELKIENEIVNNRCEEILDGYLTENLTITARDLHYFSPKKTGTQWAFFIENNRIVKSMCEYRVVDLMREERESEKNLDLLVGRDIENRGLIMWVGKVDILGEYVVGPNGYVWKQSRLVFPMEIFDEQASNSHHVLDKLSAKLNEDVNKQEQNDTPNNNTYDNIPQVFRHLSEEINHPQFLSVLLISTVLILTAVLSGRKIVKIISHCIKSGNKPRRDEGLPMVILPTAVPVN